MRAAGPALAEVCRPVGKSPGPRCQAEKSEISASAVNRVRSPFTYYFAIHDERPKPFVWTKMAAEIFASLETI